MYEAKLTLEIIPNVEEENSIQNLIERYQDFLMSRCRKLTHGNKDDANDLFSAVMLKVCNESKEQLQKINHFGGWLNRVAHNQFIDDQRERVASERRDDSLRYFYETISYEAPSPEQEYLNNELKQHLNLAFESLPERLRRAAHMKFHEDAPYEEIAADLSINQANARKHIQEARTILKKQMRRYTAGHHELT